MEIIQHKPNKTNGLKKTKIIVKALGKVVDEFEVPSYKAVAYCLKYPNGKHGKRYAAAVAEAEKKDKWLEEMEMRNHGAYYREEEMERKNDS